eukprot:gnl/TRDRNA2_/TRDRNA2_175062_c0_seq1.p1 gnl/TRDRNA2_/TRDRNA2_175062_c0~~gnl/TRDRNA2_/TRDRNA2_175062_c0_seq1.p1  ORF type:complete len:103 (-),score=14.43 gnl/TRDRNA2_/TRDRNA2_175062_c0_seq1:1-309(-)
MCLLGGASYIANLSSLFLLDNLDVGLQGIDDLIATKAKVCVQTGVKDVIMAAYPELTSLIVPVLGAEYENIVIGMDSGSCSAGLMNEKDFLHMRSSSCHGRS